VGFVEEVVSLGKVNDLVIWFPLPVQFHQRSKLISKYTFQLPEGQAGEAWETSIFFLKSGRDFWKELQLMLWVSKGREYSDYYSSYPHAIYTFQHEKSEIFVQKYFCQPVR